MKALSSYLGLSLLLSVLFIVNESGAAEAGQPIDLPSYIIGEWTGENIDGWHRVFRFEVTSDKKIVGDYNSVRGGQSEKGKLEGEFLPDGKRIHVTVYRSKVIEFTFELIPDGSLKSGKTFVMKKTR